jgi:hypothetical protein
MKHKWFMCIGFVVLLLGLIYAGYRTSQWYRWREQPDAATGVELILGPKLQTVKVGDSPLMAASLFNRGAKEVILVAPGDGSEFGGRTPLIEWSCNGVPEVTLPVFHPLKESEVFVLEPGHRRAFPRPLECPPFFSPGRYKVSMRYTNIPDHLCRGNPDPGALEKVRRSTEVSAVSNSVDIIVE